LLKVFYLDAEFGLSCCWLEFRFDQSGLRVFFDLFEYHVFFLLDFFFDLKFLLMPSFFLVSAATTMLAPHIILFAVGYEHADYLPEIDQHHHLKSACVIHAISIFVFQWDIIREPEYLVSQNYQRSQVENRQILVIWADKRSKCRHICYHGY